MIEGTIDGIAAGLVSRGLADGAVSHRPQLDVFLGDDDQDDIALIDATVYDESFVGSRAMWDADKIVELVLTQARPGAIGLSSIGAHAQEVNGTEQGAYLRFGPGGRQVVAPIAPGLVQTLSVVDQRALSSGDEVAIDIHHASTLAYDGERETTLQAGTRVRIRLNATGPRVVDAKKAIELAAQDGVFLDE
jgi:hypothetical protein